MLGTPSFRALIVTALLLLNFCEFNWQGHDAVKRRRIIEGG